MKNLLEEVKKLVEAYPPGFQVHPMIAAQQGVRAGWVVGYRMETESHPAGLLLADSREEYEEWWVDFGPEPKWYITAPANG